MCGICGYLIVRHSEDAEPTGLKVNTEGSGEIPDMVEWLLGDACGEDRNSYRGSDV